MAFSKAEWQRENRRAFKERHGYSSRSGYRFGGNRDAVLQRDAYKCVVCGMTDAEHRQRWGRPITVDHVDKDEKNNALENLRTMCLVCHGRKDISPALVVRQVEKFKDEIIRRRNERESFQSIADHLGFSIAAVWKWYRRWTGAAGIQRCDER